MINPAQRKPVTRLFVYVPTMEKKLLMAASGTTPFDKEKKVNLAVRGLKKLKAGQRLGRKGSPDIIDHQEANGNLSR